MREIYFVLTGLIIDTIFFIDVLICFRTTYIDDTGEEIFGMYKIASNYIRGSFVLDFFSTIPIDYIYEAIAGVDAGKLSLFGALKLARLLRIKKLI